MRITREFEPAADPAFFQETPRRADWDPLVDVFLPLALYLMLASLVWFLIDVQAALAEGPTRLLRWVFGFFMLAVVGIARIKAREGMASASLYGVLLLGTMGLFGYFYSFGGGAFGGGFGGGSPVVSLGLNYLIIGFIWWAGNYITDRTTVDPSSIEVQQSGLLSSEEWAAEGDRAAAVRRRPHPGRAVMVLSACAAVIFGLGHGPVQADPVFRTHAFLCMQVFCASALVVLAMSALSGLSVYARMRGTRLPMAVTGLWILLAFPLAALLVVFANVAPRLEPREGSWLPRVPEVIERLTTRLDDAPVEGFRRAEDSSATHRGSGSHAQDEPGGPRAAGEDGRQEGGDEPGAEQGEGDAVGGEESGGDAGEGQGGEGGEGGEEGEQQEPTREGGEDGEQGRERRPESLRPPDAAAAGSLLVSLLKLAGIVLAVVVAFFVLRALARLWRGLKLPGLPAWLRRRERETPGPTRDPFVDPFGPRSPLRGRPPVEVVRHVYRAFGAYCELIGCPRRPDLTAHEFLHELPPSTDSWRTEIRELTDLYAAAEYTPTSVDEAALDELRPIWARLMRAVSEYRGR